MVKAWYVVDNMLFVRRVETDMKDTTLKYVIKSYSHELQIYNGVIIKQGTWGTYVPWQMIEKIESLSKAA